MLAVHPHNLTPAQAAAAAGTHGLGIISDAASATVIRRVNGDRSLRLTCPWNEKNANLLIADRLICYAGQYYRITIPSRRERGSRRTISLEAPHVMYDLEHSYIVNIETAEDPDAIDGIDAATALQQVLAGSAFSPGTVDLDEKLEYLDLLEVSRTEALEQIIQKWGGELQPDNWTLHLRQQTGADRGLQIRVGKNIKGIDCTEDISQVVTRLHVLGYQGANFESINDGKNYIDSPHIGRYAFVREAYVTFDDDEDPQELMRLGQEELAQRDKPRLTVRVDMARLRGSAQYAWVADLERVDEGDTVTVHHEFLGQNVRLRAMEVETDCLTGDVLMVTLGEVDTEGLFQGFSSFVRTAELVRKILDHDGHVRARTLRGEIDLLTTRLIASGSYQNATVIPGKGALLENTNTSSPDYGALYIGPGMLAIADSKNADGTWAWRTFGTGRGFSGSEILAYSIHGTKIMAHTIGVEQLAPEIITEVVNNATGQQFVMELSNGSILDEDNISTIASLRVYHQGVEITARIPAAAVRWERASDDPVGDAAFNADPAHIGTKTITVAAADVDWRGVLRCRIDEVRLYAVPEYRNGKLYMVDFGSGDALNFTARDGVLYYEGPNNYSARDGALYIDMTIGAGQVETTLQNLHTSFISMTRRGIRVYGNGYLYLGSGGKLTIDAGSDLEIKSGGSFDLVTGSGSTYMRLTNKDSDVRLLVGGETKESAPFWITPQGGVRATALQLNNSNITDFTAPIQYSDADNADPNNPMIFDVFMPAEYLGIQSLKLSFKRQPFRAYSTGAGSGGGSAVTSRGGGANSPTSRSGGGQTSNQVAQVTIGGNSVRSGGASGETVAHTHVTILPDWYVPAHAHGMPTHTHVVDIPEHTHILDIPAHTHGIIYGIYQGPTATSCNVYVDGNFVGAFPSMNAYNVVAWLTKSAGKITRDSWHNISIYPNALCRIVAQAFGLALIGRAENTIY